MTLEYHLDYNEAPVVGQQTLKLVITPESFARELASARTFLLKQEADWLRQQGLGARVTYEHVLVFDDHGPLQNQLRYDDECVRHKALDVVGDLALSACDIHADVIAYRSGHKLNAELVSALLDAEAQRWRESA